MAEQDNAATEPQQPQPATASAPEYPVPPLASVKSEDDELALDLDELNPSGKKIRVDGKIVTLQQPSTEQLLDLIRFGKKLQGMTRDNYDMDVLGEVLKQVTDIAKSLAPELKDYKFNIVQALALINLLQGMAMPERLKELNKRGVTAAEVPKDAAS